MSLDRIRLINAVFFPFIFVAALWAITGFAYLFHENLSWLGLYPRSAKGLAGIITAPFVHGDIYHLLSNTVPLLVLGSALFYFYRGIALQVFLWIWFMTGLWVWVAARPAYHIGASGLVYGLASFLFFSGVIRRDRSMLIISLLVIFLYGGLVWGLFPIFPGISFESHFMGFLAGAIAAIFFRKEGPPSEKFEWPEEEEEDDPNAEWKSTSE